MKTYIRWEEASLEDRMAVYTAYLEKDKEVDYFGFGAMSFEEFDAACRLSTFKGIRNMYM